MTRVPDEFPVDIDHWDISLIPIAWRVSRAPRCVAAVTPKGPCRPHALGPLRGCGCVAGRDRLAAADRFAASCRTGYLARIEFTTATDSAPHEHLVDVHRHRMPPQIADRIEAAQSSDQLRVCAGRIVGCTVDGSQATVMFRGRESGSLEILRGGTRNRLHRFRHRRHAKCRPAAAGTADQSGCACRSTSART